MQAVKAIGLKIDGKKLAAILFITPAKGSLGFTDYTHDWQACDALTAGSGLSGPKNRMILRAAKDDLRDIGKSTLHSMPEAAAFFCE